ncbi:heat shock protein 70 (HSP70)-interacting protein, putative [Ixodes scapularis]|uniref:RNA polymerase II-associated protein 3 n=1 Tax=Ixodes scapularis TaxID=6945 RepID=B7PI94_IXOSC|nr:heat shock protein 70 (HSP70)-interacting protein, putative [Ixodes scapularis]|eukprot:XP_002404675.1 heat shock protein 70 (HSP70)-interacting protein, putative [Ixodes scapularis]
MPQKVAVSRHGDGVTEEGASQEYRDYVRNLRNWEQSVKMKDSELRSLKSKLQAPTEPTPVKRPASCEAAATAAEDGAEASEVAREEGNQLFKEGRYDEAIESYGIGIECDPRNPMLYANRAMAFLRKNMLGAAEEDCSRALAWDDGYVKAYHRRGLARDGLGKHQLAAEDFRRVLQLDPSNKEAAQRLRVLELKIKTGDAQKSEAPQQQESRKTVSKPDAKVEKAAVATVVKVAPIFKPKCECSKRPLRRVPIQDVPSVEGDASTENADAPSALPRAPDVPAPAQSAFQFYVDWKRLARFPDLRYHYLKQLDPTRLPFLFRQSMETELFSEMLVVLEEHFVRDDVDVGPILENVAKVGRFSTMVMLLGKEDQTRKLTPLMLCP